MSNITNPDEQNLLCNEDFAELEKIIKEQQKIDDIINILDQDLKTFFINQIYTRKILEQQILQDITNKNETPILQDLKITNQEIYEELMKHYEITNPVDNNANAGTAVPMVRKKIKKKQINNSNVNYNLKQIVKAGNLR